jgi:hypothetical protein
VNVPWAHCDQIGLCLRHHGATSVATGMFGLPFTTLSARLENIHEVWLTR